MSNVTAHSFSSGELAPSLYGRSDQQRYATGLRTCRNFIVRKEGGVVNRPGMVYVSEVVNSEFAVRLYPFIYNDAQTYVLEFGEQTLAFYRDGAPVMVDTPVTGWNNATAYVVGDIRSRNGVVYYAIQAGTNHDPDTSPTYWYAMPGFRYVIPTLWAAADVDRLQFAQSADVMTIVHPNYAPVNLSRFGETNWTLSDQTYNPTIAAPTALNVTGANPTLTFSWIVTSVQDSPYQESLGSAPFTSALITPTVASSCAVAFTGTGADRYNVYRSNNGGPYGFIGSSTFTFIDVGVEPDTTLTPPVSQNPFVGAAFPQAVGYYQQRRLFGGALSEPETIHTTKTGDYGNFSTSRPLQDDDALTFTLAGRYVNEIRAFVDLGKLLVFTSQGVYSVNGDADGVLRPAAINPRQESVRGIGRLAPIQIDTGVLFVQSRGSIVRSLASDPVNGYLGSDLTVFSSHLVDGHTIADWSYQESPSTVVWLVRDDGVLLGLTYLPEQQVIGWHRHDTDGVIENVCCVPEGNEDAVYVCVRRTVGVAQYRYVERLDSRRVVDVRDTSFVDSALFYDGRNTDTTAAGQMILVGGTTWDHDDNGIQAVANTAQFTATDATNGNGIHFTAADGSTVRVVIETYINDTVVLVRATRTVPADLQNNATVSWAKAVNRVAGIHLEGRSLSIVGDGYVVANPNNPQYDVVTVAGGIAQLDRNYAVIWAGLPYLSDLETLDIETPQGGSLKDKAILVNEVGLFLEGSRGAFAGDVFPTGTNPVQNLYEYKLRQVATLTEVPALVTDFVTVPIGNQWTNHGRCVVRNVDPLPLAILSITPTGFLPVNG